MMSALFVLTAAAAQWSGMVHEVPLLMYGGMAAAAAGLYWHHRSQGHSRAYVAGGVLTALIPVAGPVLGLLLKPAPPAGSEAERGLSYRSWAIFLLFPAVLSAMLSGLFGPAMPLAFLAASALSLLAWLTARAGRSGAAIALFLSNFGACSGLAYRSLQDSDLVRNSDAGATKGHLGLLRQGLAESLAGGSAAPAALPLVTRYGGKAPEIPPAKLGPYHAPSSAVAEGPEPTDAGGWLYDRAASTPTVRVNCTHTDPKHTVWSAY
jgi:hypothetical protein